MLARRTLLVVGLTTVVWSLTMLVLRIAGSLVVDGNDVEAARMAVAVTMLQKTQHEGSVLYLGFGDSNPLEEELELLVGVNPQLRLRPLAERTSANDWCDSQEMRVGPCQKDDFLDIGFIEMLAWRTALVRWRTTGCHGSYLVINAFGKWRPVAEPWTWSCF